jgi:hypothetical protein
VLNAIELSYLLKKILPIPTIMFILHILPILTNILGKNSRKYKFCFVKGGPDLKVVIDDE